MATVIQIPQNVEASTPLGALIAHFNASSKNVQRAFTKLMVRQVELEEQTKLQAKVENGVNAIQSGQGISRLEGESISEFFDRLCTE